MIHYYRPGEHLEAQGDPPRTPLHVLVYNEAFDQESRRAEEWQGRGRLGQHMVQVTGQESDEDLVRLVSDWVGRTLEAAERASRLQQIALRIHTMHYYAHVYLLRVREALAARASLEAPAAAGTTQGNDLPQRRTVVSTRTGPRAR